MHNGPDQRIPDSCIMIVFGASGDLTARKIVPALYNLRLENRLPPSFHVVGYARSELSDNAFRRRLLDGLRRYSRNSPQYDGGVWSDMQSRIHYRRGDYDSEQGLAELREMLARLENERGTPPQNRLFYFAVPPRVVEPLLSGLIGAGLLERRVPDEERRKGFHRIVLEKPFGRDLASANKLNRTLQKNLEESQIDRMDHYLGKETVQNIMVLRFANAIFEPIWNNRYVKNIHITVAESEGVGTRARYFDSTGALRDVLQNHVLQLLALFAMEPPSVLNAEAIKAEKSKLLGALAPVSGSDLRCSVLRGQYGRGRIDGRDVPGYREEDGVAPDSCTETFAAIRAYINNWRWAGVPFYLTSGKRLARKLSEVAVEFREAPHRLFGSAAPEGLDTNMLRIQVEPDERVALRVNAKVPGLKMKLTAADMDLPYSARFSGQSPEAYERLLLDAIAGDQSLFAGNREIELSWQYVQPVLQFWAAQPEPEFPDYPAGSWGPVKGRDFFREDICYLDLKRRMNPGNGEENAE